MPFEWPEFLTLAEGLSKRNDEAALRTAVSRAYYYVYHLGRQRILDNGFHFNKGADTHKQVWEKFAADVDFRCRKLNSLAKMLHDKRKQADYDIPYPMVEKEFPALLDIAKRFASDLNAIDKRLPVNRGVKN
jgi:uncharacterized protein (UPF0332 family)